MDARTEETAREIAEWSGDWEGWSPALRLSRSRIGCGSCLLFATRLDSFAFRGCCLLFFGFCVEFLFHLFFSFIAFIADGFGEGGFYLFLQKRKKRFSMEFICFSSLFWVLLVLFVNLVVSPNLTLFAAVICPLLPPFWSTGFGVARVSCTCMCVCTYIGASCYTSECGWVYTKEKRKERARDYMVKRQVDRTIAAITSMDLWGGGGEKIIISTLSFWLFDFFFAFQLNYAMKTKSVYTSWWHWTPSFAITSNCLRI